MADLGGAGGAAAFALASFRKIQGLPVSKIVRTADSTIIIITNFYLAASSHEIFLRVEGRESMKGLGALQRHQLPPPPLQKSWIRHCLYLVLSTRRCAESGDVYRDSGRRRGLHSAGGRRRVLRNVARVVLDVGGQRHAASGRIACGCIAEAVDVPHSLRAGRLVQIAFAQQLQRLLQLPRRHLLTAVYSSGTRG